MNNITRYEKKLLIFPLAILALIPLVKYKFTFWLLYNYLFIICFLIWLTVTFAYIRIYRPSIYEWRKKENLKLKPSLDFIIAAIGALIIYMLFLFNIFHVNTVLYIFLHYVAAITVCLWAASLTLPLIRQFGHAIKSGEKKLSLVFIGLWLITFGGIILSLYNMCTKKAF